MEATSGCHNYEFQLLRMQPDILKNFGKKSNYSERKGATFYSHPGNIPM